MKCFTDNRRAYVLAATVCALMMHVGIPEDGVGQSFSFKTESTHVKVWYDDGTFMTFETDLNDPGITNLVAALDEYYSTGSHCYIGNMPPACDLRFVNTRLSPDGTTEIKQHFVHTFHFDLIDVVQITRNLPPARGCPAQMGNIHVASERGEESFVLGFNADWTKVISDIDYGFLRFMSAWKDQLSSGQPLKRKWRFFAKCNAGESIIYFNNPMNIRHVGHISG